MNGDQALDVAREAIMALLLASMPLMLVALGVGLIVSVFQALTQLQEMTLTFVPKILIVFVSLLFLLPFIVNQLEILTLSMADKIVAIGGL